MKTWQVFSLAGLIATGVSMWSGPAQAQYFGGNIDQREAAQEQRIRDGFHSGAITPREAQQLGAQQQRIRDAEARMRSDGRLNYQERARLDRMQDNAGGRIYQQGHDNQVYSGHPNNHEPRYRNWQNYRRRDYRQGNYHHRGRGCDRNAFRPNHGERGRSSLPHQRDRRMAWR
jgi:hypothetical protein